MTDTKQYIVSCLAVTGKGNRVFKSGQLVSEADFPKGNAAALARRRKLKEYDASAPIKVASVHLPDPAKVLGGANQTSPQPPQEGDTKSPPPAGEAAQQQGVVLTREALEAIEDINDLRKLCTDRGVAFRPNQGKKQLIDLLLSPAKAD